MTSHPLCVQAALCFVFVIRNGACDEDSVHLMLDEWKKSTDDIIEFNFRLLIYLLLQCLLQMQPLQYLSVFPADCVLVVKRHDVAWT
jgi:hypothetical protein